MLSLLLLGTLATTWTSLLSVLRVETCGDRLAAFIAHWGSRNVRNSLLPKPGHTHTCMHTCSLRLYYWGEMEGSSMKTWTRKSVCILTWSSVSHHLDQNTSGPKFDFERLLTEKVFRWSSWTRDGQNFSKGTQLCPLRKEFPWKKNSKENKLLRKKIKLIPK